MEEYSYSIDEELADSLDSQISDSLLFNIAQMYHFDFNQIDSAVSRYTELVDRFPESKYRTDSYQKIVLINENIAAKHMSIGLFYLKRNKYVAAMNRFKKIIDNHSKSKFTPEALYRLVEIYYSLGMLEDAKKTASVIGHNYPKSKWYEYSYYLVTNNKKEKDIKFLQKISNFLKINEKKE